ncbi:MAG: hypothetical protein MZV64_13040 [Ignavibacteriales bacterium]|nr:hypothetical protein [Ignavibacteriales bacterium]
MARPGGTSAPAPSATWAPTSWTSPSGPWTSKPSGERRGHPRRFSRRILRARGRGRDLRVPRPTARVAPVKLTWWDGGLMPPRPAELEPGRMVGDDGGGCFFRGDKGLLMCGTLRREPAARSRDPDARTTSGRRRPCPGRRASARSGSRPSRTGPGRRPTSPIPGR